MPEKVRVGFVGVGNMGQCAHLKNYAALPDCDVVAIAEPRAELARLVAARYEIPRTYSSAAAMMEKEELDALVAIQGFERHGSVVQPLYAFGIPLMTEKPLASSVEVGERLLAALNEGGSWHMVGYHKRSDPATEAAKAEIDRLKASGEIGRLRYVRITMPEGDWIASGFQDLIRTNEEPPLVTADPCPGDMDPATFRRYVTFANYYIHQVNLMRYLLGESYSVSHADAGGIVLTVTSESGASGLIEMSPYRTATDWQESALVAFERGYVKLDLPAPLVTNRAGAVEFFRDRDGQPPDTRRPQVPRVHAMRRQAANFLAAVRGEAKPMCEAAEALDDLRIARDYVTRLNA
jgi:predicted dehydrogenase